VPFHSGSWWPFTLEKGLYRAPKRGFILRIQGLFIRCRTSQLKVGIGYKPVSTSTGTGPVWRIKNTWNGLSWTRSYSGGFFIRGLFVLDFLPLSFSQTAFAIIAATQNNFNPLSNKIIHPLLPFLRYKPLAYLSFDVLDLFPAFFSVHSCLSQDKVGHVLVPWVADG